MPPNAIRSILRQARDEDVWQFLHEDWLGDRIFVFDEDIPDQCRPAWTKLIARPWMITPLGLPPRPIGHDHRTRIGPGRGLDRVLNSN
jgi:hypothetical protein